LVIYEGWNERVMGDKIIVDEKWQGSKKREKRGNDEEKTPFGIFLKDGDAFYQDDNGKNDNHGYRNLRPRPCKKANDDEK
jgi:hypothetical protein